MDKVLEAKILEFKYILPRRLLEAKVGTSDSLTFEVRTKEQGHNTPHVHVSTSCASISISIEDGVVLAQTGNIQGKNIKKAQEWIEENKNYLKTKWNELANCPIKFPI